MKKTMFWFAGLAVGVMVIAAMAGSIEWNRAGRMIIGVSAAVALFFVIRRYPAHVVTGRSRYEGMEILPAESTVRFADVAANQEALEHLKELTDYLKNPEKYASMGARFPRGVLLYGPPGTGKTLMARALAGEAEVPFYSLAGSDFVQMYAGVGAGRVRDLFQKARKAGRCVIFIDEIDALGKRRDELSSDEREQTLNALLSEMSGFTEMNGVIVLAATNRIETLDPALTRPGRFDRHIEVGLPGRRERLDVLKLHCRNKKISGTVNLEALAADTVRFSGAALESLINDAAIRAARRGAEQIEPADVEAAYLGNVVGSDRAATADRQELTQIALHEAGHAVASLLLLPENRLARISIVPSSRGAGGYNLSVPAEHMMVNKEKLCHQIQVLLAGRAAEMLLTGQDGISSGAANDLEKAGELAACMVMELGMGDNTAVSVRTLQKYCQCHSREAYAQCSELLNNQMKAISQLLSAHTDELMKLTEELLLKETLNTGDLQALFPHFFAGKMTA